METTALYIGYAVLAILGLALLAFAIFTLYLVVLGFHRIITTNQTIWFMKKSEAKAFNKGGWCAYNYLIKLGCPTDITLEEVANRLRKHQNYYKLNKDK